MKAIRVEQAGGPEVLQLQDVAPVEEPGPGQAVVRVVEAGVNFMDVQQRRGRYGSQFPFTPGAEGAGVVESLGKGVRKIKPGERVAFTGQPGAYAEAVAVQADRLIRLPDNFSFEEGAAFPLQGMTAHYLINEFHQVVKGDVVLVHAASGGVGLLLVQWAKHLGARVIGTTSTEEKAQIAREAGADEIILYTQRDFATETKRLTSDHGVDLIFDAVGKTTFPGDLQAVAARGTIVIYGAASGPADPIVPNSLMAHSLTLSGGSLPQMIASQAELKRRSRDVIRGIEEGWLKIRIDKVFPLEQASEAHRLLEDRQTSGKLLLSITGQAA